MTIIENDGQWHDDVDRVHDYSNGDWVIVFRDSNGYLDSSMGASVKVSIPVKFIPSKTAALEHGLEAFVTTGEKANLVMINCPPA